MLRHRKFIEHQDVAVFEETVQLRKAEKYVALNRSASRVIGLRCPAFIPSRNGISVSWKVL